MCKMQDQFEEWASEKQLSLPVNRSIGYNQHTQIAWESWQAASAARGAEETAVEEFFERYNSAINNPAPDDDGGTTAYELERLLDEAVLLLEKLA